MGIQTAKITSLKSVPEIPNSEVQSKNGQPGIFASGFRKSSWILHAGQLPNPIEVRKTTSDATRSLKISQSTPCSSNSSLCDCNSILHSGAVEDSLFEIHAPEILYLPTLTPTQLSGDALSWQLIFPEISIQSPISRHLKPNRPSMLDEHPTVEQSGGLNIKSCEDEQTHPENPCSTRDPKSETLTESVEKMIEETNRAFHAVGIALADARAVTREVIKDTTSGLQKPRGSHRKSEMHLQSPVSNARVEKIESKSKWTRRESIKRTVSFRRKFPKKPSSVAKLSFRETVNDVVADEMHSQRADIPQSEGVEESKPTRWYSPDDVSYSSREESLDSARSIEADGYTPTDPFYLQCLSTRISMAQQNSAMPAAAPIIKPQQNKQLQGQWSLDQEQKSGDAQIVSSGTPFDNKATNSEILKPQVPPRPLRFCYNSRGVPLLPTIPEMSPFKLKPVELHDRMVKFPPLSKRIPEAYITLHSTTFTMTAPLFRHGPIRIDRKTPDYSVISPLDEALDWTAFQMAILGTMDENGGDQRDDWEWAANEKELDDLVVWFESFGFEGYGQLEGLPLNEALLQDLDKGGILRSTSRVTYDVRNDLEQRRGTLDASLWKGDSGYLRDARNPNVRGQYLGMSERRPSIESSLPESPMFDLLTPYPNSDEECKIPMASAPRKRVVNHLTEELVQGYNLGHDLGDFLDWEIRNVQFLGGGN